MGLFDSVTSIISSQLGDTSGDPRAALLHSLVATLSSNPGALSGMIEKFQSSGLGAEVASWIGHESNLPVSAEQVSAALGGAHLSDLAAKAGLSTDAAAGHLAELLPQIIDQLSPNGALPSGNLAGALGMLQGLFTARAS